MFTMATRSWSTHHSSQLLDKEGGCGKMRNGVGVDEIQPVLSLSWEKPSNNVDVDAEIAIRCWGWW